VPRYNDLQKCYRLFERGVPALKLNYSDDKIRRVIVKMTPLTHVLYYEDVDKPQKFNLWKTVMGPRKFKPSDFKGVLYGSLSANFQKHRKAMLKRTNDERIIKHDS